MAKDFVLLITADALGKDAPELAKKLMNNYLYTLTEAEELPTHILFLNSGVLTLVEGADTEATLADLSNKGVKVMACGTCVDYFQVREKITVGEITNMYNIRDIMARAAKVITLG